MSELVRTFIAIDFDNPSIVSRVMEVQRELRECGIIAKDVEPHNLHLTLWFLGELRREKLEAVLKEVSRVKFREFELRVKGLGYFPGGARINVVWLGVEDPGGMLKNILGQLVNGLGRVGFKYDERGFTPHLTIARVKQIRDKQRALETIGRLKDLEAGSQTVSAIKVKRSQLTSSGPIYTDLLRVEAEKAP